MPKDSNRTQYRTVKIRLDSHQELHELIDRAARTGWASLGSDRMDKVTIANVLDEAIQLLKARKQLAKK
jgi:hypothetical protein